MRYSPRVWSRSLRSTLIWLQCGFLVLGAPLPAAAGNGNGSTNKAARDPSVATGQASGIFSATANPLTGAAELSFPIAVPPGTNGVEPGVGLSYSSSSRSPSWVGQGWELELGSIELSLKRGVPDYLGQNDVFTLDGEELVKDPEDPRFFPGTTVPTRFRTRRESYQRIDMNIFSGGFEVRTTDGTVRRYGSTDASRLRCTGSSYCDQIAAAFGGAAPTFSWALDAIETPDGNIVEFKYYPQTDAGGGDVGQLYPREIRYTLRRNGAAVTSLNGLAPPQSMDRVVRFVLEARRSVPASPPMPSEPPPTEDNRVTYEARFERQLTKRLSKIEVLVGTKILRSYQLKYRHSEDSLTSLLTSIEERGLEDQGPPLVSTFSYTTNQPLCTNCLNVWRQTPRYSLPVNFVEVGEIDGGIREADVNLDGITDFVRNLEASRIFSEMTGDNELDPPALVKNGTYLSTPTGANGFSYVDTMNVPLVLATAKRSPTLGITTSQDAGTALADINGDGLADQLQLIVDRVGTNVRPVGATRRIHLRQATGGFDPPAEPGRTIDAGNLENFHLSLLGQRRGTSDDPAPDGISGGTSLVELNGDGFPDLVQAFFQTNQNAEGKKYAINLIGRGGLQQNPVAGFFSPGDGNYVICDALLDPAFNAVNPRPECRADGLMTDVIFDGDERFSGGEPRGKRYFDVNGDGLDDYQNAFSTPTRQSRFTILNDGSKFQRRPASSAWNLPEGLFFERQEGMMTLDTGLRLVDVNADGNEDLVVATEAVGAQPAMRRIFLGSQSISQPWRAVPDTSPFRIPDDMAFIGGAMSMDRAVRIVDVTGDAVPDLIRADKGTTRAYFSDAIVPDLLKVATTPQGGTQTFTYGTSALERSGSEPLNPGLTQNMTVVKQLTMFDGKNEPVVTTFTYQGGKFDGADREFRGFAAVRAMRANTNPPGVPSNARTTEMFFALDQARAGLLEGMVVRDAALAPLIATSMFYTKDDGLDTPAPPFASLLEVVRTQEFGAGGVERLTQMTMDYERRPVTVDGIVRNVIQFGRVVNMVDFGAIGPNGADLVASDTRIVELEYAPANLDLYIVDLVSAEQLRGISGAPLRRTESTYDDGVIPPTRGRLTSTIERLSDPNNKPDPQTKFTYDDFGNMKSTIGPRQNTVPSQGNATTTFDYDTTFQTFMTRVTNPANQVTQLSYTPTTECPGGPPMGSGLLYTKRGPNDTPLTLAVNCYDHFGRITLERESGDLEETRTVYQDIPGAFLVLAQQRITSSSVRSTTMELDGFGRMKKMTVSGPQGRTIEVQTALDGAGRLLETRAPFFQGDPVPAPTVTRYDALDRIIRVEEPAAPAPSAGGLRVSTAAFDLGVVTNVDANGNTIRRTMDPFGNITKVEEVTDTGTFTTRYEYDIADQLVKIVDAEGNETRIDYDRLGRRERVFDPDLGRSPDLLARTYEYDVEGNLMRETTPAGTWEFEYDVLDRVKMRRTATGVVSTFAYDNAAAKGIGLLRSVTDGTGTFEVLQYDELGRETSSRRSIDGFQFNFGTSYDQMGRVASRSLPNGRSYTINLDPLGYAQSITTGSGVVPDETNPITGIQFDAAGRLAQYQSANLVTTTKRFEANTRRLSEIEIRKAAAPAEALEHRRYFFDRGDRIFRIDDLVPTSNRDQVFEYDRLDRLTEATGPYNPGLASTTLYYRYSPTGNLTCLDSTDDILCAGGKSLAYRAGGVGVQRPHAPISVNGAAVSYTESGNLASLGSRSYGYNEFDQLTSVAEAGRALARFTYTSDGSRIRSEDLSGRRAVVTYLLDDDFEFDATRKLARTHLALDDEDTLATITEPFAPSGGSQAHLLPSPAPLPVGPYAAVAFMLLAALALLLQLAARYRRGYALGGPAFAGSMALVFLFSTIPGAAWALPLDGDLNRDGRLDAADVQIAIAIANGRSPNPDPTTAERESGDVAPLETAPQNPSEINVGDAVLLLRAAQGEDVDADGVAADIEIAFGSSPFRRDTDRDGLNDDSELAQGSDPRANVDLDGDGLRDLEEFAKKTDPDDPDTDGDGVPDSTDVLPRNGTAFLHGDQISSTILVTGNGGGVVQRAAYRPFGATVAASATAPARTPRFGFTGERFEAGIGIYDYGARFYDPGLGRFLQPDPIVARPGDPQNLNRYAYTRNNPISRIDPGGNIDLDFAGIAGEKAGRFLFGERGATIGRGVGSFLGGFIPGTGEIADAGILFDPNESTGDRLLAGASLGLSLVTLGFAPNFGGSARALKKGVSELVDQGKSTAKKAAKQAERRAPDISIPVACVCFTAGTPVWTPDGPVPIEALEVGDRVMTAQTADDPADMDTGTEVSASWRVAELRMHYPDQPNDPIDIVALRPAEWFAAHDITLGRWLMVELGEFQLRGYAEVIDIRGPPAIEAGPGRVVLTTISRTNTEVLDLRIAGLVEPLEITSKHRLYSSDRADWVHAEELLEGELLETDGGTAQVLSVEPKAGAHRVYNIEVETDHEYLVSDLAVRSHNANKGKGGKGGCGPGGTGGVGPVNAGKKGDALGKARETRNGATLLGEQISIARVGDPKMRIFARIDLLTFLKKRLRFNENKFGDSARLSAGQIELDEILSSGGSVLLVGKNARDQVPKRFLGVPVGGDFFENRFGQTKKSKSKSKSKSKAKSSRRRR